MRALAIVAALTLAPQLAAAADLDGPHTRPSSAKRRHVRVHAEAYGYAVERIEAPLRPIVVAPRPTVLVIPPGERPPGLAYAPPPVPVTPPPLINAVPIVGPYLVPYRIEPPPATVLDAYDHRTDYNQ